MKIPDPALHAEAAWSAPTRPAISPGVHHGAGSQEGPREDP